MPNGTPREVAFLVCLSEAYELAGRKIADSTIMSAAKEMASRIPCQDSDIKELFVTAREIDNIPTIKTLWKAWDMMSENRVYDNSTLLTCDSLDDNRRLKEMERRINIHETLKILAYKTGKYMQLCTAYLHVKKNGKYEYKYPGLKHDFDSEMMPLLEKICGKALGDNPCDPNHPIQRYRA